MKRLFTQSLHGFAVIFLATLAFGKSAEIAPNEKSVAEGFLKSPASLAETVERHSE